MSAFALDIHVTGIVQGVGFRPFVFRLAQQHGMRGWVLNGTDGVHIHAEGPEPAVDAFVLDITECAPAAARVERVRMTEVPAEGFEDFSIRFSEDEDVEATTLVSPDLATCDECVAELFDPENRRYRYPFINCTNCGPRFTIIEGLPYDRPMTSMKSFPMCPECAAEYANPADRRFHAQPDACWECGPHIWSAVLPNGERADAAGASGGTSDPCFAHGAHQSALGAKAGQLHSPDAPSLTFGSSGNDNAVGIDKTVTWGMTREESDAILARAVDMLRAGDIVAVKGLGGFHLCCDAANPQALAKLRERKRRPGKAFAVMVRTLEDVRAVCEVNDAEVKLLQSPARPIVLLRKREDAHFAAGLADGLPELGVMLPATPLQHLLLADFGGMLVMTSGNVHDEPICIYDDEARTRLAGIADAIIGHDRAILSRYDDSVARVLDLGGGTTAVQMIRRARGYAPLPLALPTSTSSRPTQPPAAAGAQESAPTEQPEPTAFCVFAAGPEQKVTFCITRPGEAFVSQHIGDVENAATFDAWLAAKATYEHLLRLTPTHIVHDAHPEYLTSKWAATQAHIPTENLSHNEPEVSEGESDECSSPAFTSSDLTVAQHAKQGADVPSDSPAASARPSFVRTTEQVQHHHAHVAAVMAENNLEGPVCGIAFDGTGYGADGAIWGGEVLLSNLHTYERFANVAYFPLPGGAAAIKNPLRIAYGLLWACDLLDHPGAAAALQALGGETETLEAMIDRGLNCPNTSSMGRIFDAISALLGLCTTPTYEGEGAVLLEAALPRFGTPSTPGEEPAPDERYSFALTKNTATETSTALDTSVVLLDPEPMVRAVLDDLAAGVDTATIALRFHQGIVSTIVTIAQVVQAAYDITTVALAGGVFMNRYITEHAVPVLTAAGFTVAISRDLPPNDGAISFGQAVVALQSIN